jgi:hypothetical protein
MSSLSRLARILLFICFTGCTTTEISDTLPEPMIGPAPMDVPIKVFPHIKIPLQEQIRLGIMLGQLSPKEKAKIIQKLKDGMYKSDRELLDRGMTYPKQYIYMDGYL